MLYAIFMQTSDGAGDFLDQSRRITCRERAIEALCQRSPRYIFENQAEPFARFNDSMYRRHVGVGNAHEGARFSQPTPALAFVAKRRRGKDF